MSTNKDNSVWILDDDRSIRWVLEKSLNKNGIATTSFASGEELLSRLPNETPNAIISDIRMPGIDGLKLLAEIRQQHPDLPVIIMTAHSDLESAVAAYRRGAFDYLPKPFDVNEAVAMTRRALGHARDQTAISNAEPEPAHRALIGEAPAMQEVFRVIGRLSNSNIPVLINGESGTGKELVARALHKHSPRRHQPFVPLNVAAIPVDLIESELFGHEKGAFTGATSQRAGRFEQANTGTLFLDEIGDMPAHTQTRLLRVLAEGEFYRVGGHRALKVDVRIIAATHQNLEKLVAAHEFREDLFHRLNVIRIQIPRLADRREDIPKLAACFLQRAAAELGVERKVLTPEAETRLTTFDWPGNVRQLENFCRWVTVIASSREILPTDLPPEIAGKETPDANAETWSADLQRWAGQRLSQGETGIVSAATALFERTLIAAALNHTGGRRLEAAALLGWGRNTLSRKIKELGSSGSNTPGFGD